jgi:hypothetical protein
MTKSLSASVLSSMPFPIDLLSRHFLMRSVDDDDQPEVSGAMNVDIEQLSWDVRSRLAMDLIIHSTLSTVQVWKNKDQRCPFCIQDPTTFSQSEPSYTPARNGQDLNV